MDRQGRMEKENKSAERCESIDTNLLLTPYLWNPEINCRIHKNSPIVPILGRIKPIALVFQGKLSVEIYSDINSSGF